MSENTKNRWIPLVIVVFIAGALGGGYPKDIIGLNPALGVISPFTLKNNSPALVNNNGVMSVPKIQNPTTASPEEEAVVNAVAKANPAVVSIVITKKVTQYFRTNRNPFADDPFFKQFFGDTNPFGDSQPQIEQPPKTDNLT